MSIPKTIILGEISVINCEKSDNILRFIKDFGPEKLVVRIPRIPGFTTYDDQIKSREQLEKYGVRRFDLFEYREW